MCSKYEKGSRFEGYCLKCDAPRPLNKSGFCVRCHRLGSDSETEWIQENRRSRMFYSEYLNEEPIKRRDRRERSLPHFLIVAYLTPKTGLPERCMVYDWVRARDCESALNVWKEFLRDEGIENPEKIFEDKVHIMQLADYGETYSLSNNEQTEYFP